MNGIEFIVRDMTRPPLKSGANLRYHNPFGLGVKKEIKKDPPKKLALPKKPAPVLKPKTRALADQVCDYLEEHGPSNLHEIADGLGFLVNTVHHSLRRLRDRQRIKIVKQRVGSIPAVYAAGAQVEPVPEAVHPVIEKMREAGGKLSRRDYAEMKGVEWNKKNARSIRVTFMRLVNRGMIESLEGEGVMRIYGIKEQK